MKRSTCALLLFGLLAVAEGVCGEDVHSIPGKGDRWALVIGVDQYDDPGLGQLGGAANDARALRDALIATAGFPAEQVTLIATGEKPDQVPTHRNILKAVRDLTSKVQRNGLLLFAFSGHGINRNDLAYLLPSDAKLDDDQTLDESAVTVQWIQRQTRDIPISQVLLLLDACKNDPGGRASGASSLSAASVGKFRFGANVVAFATLYATSPNEVAFENAEGRQGYFIGAIVDGLRGEAANDRGEVTLGRLVAYVQDTVPRQVEKLGADHHQNPLAEIFGYRADALVLVPGVEQPRVAVVAVGSDAALAAALEQEMERRLAAYGGTDERADPDIESLLQQPNLSATNLGPALSKAGFHILVLVRVENVTEDADSISNATIRLYAYSLKTNRTIGRGWTERIEYAQLSLNEKVRQSFVGATADLRRSIELAKTQLRE